MPTKKIKSPVNAQDGKTSISCIDVIRARAKGKRSFTIRDVIYPGENLNSIRNVIAKAEKQGIVEQIGTKPQNGGTASLFRFREWP
jgi:hypothetical protein